MNVLVNFDLQKRVIAFTLDNASANNAAIEIMRPQLSSYHDELFHIRCWCHIVNLIIKDGLELIQEPINKIRSGIVYISNRTPKLYRLTVCVGLLTRDPGFLVQTNYIGGIRPMSC